MKKNKKIDFNYYIYSLIFVSLASFVLLIITVSYTFYCYNSSMESEIIINKYLEKTLFKEIKSEKAETIINYQPRTITINPQEIKNPFRIIEEEKNKTAE
jgi:hypothetical protein